MTAEYKKYILNFKRPSGTSRGVLTIKETWFIIIHDNSRKGIGECGILRSLSIDDRPDYEEKLNWACENISLGKEKLWEDLIEFPSIQFGVEMAFRSLEAANPFELFPSEFTKGKDAIPINGLIWMGEKAYMKSQIEEKIASGFNCIKLKIGAIDFDSELELLKYIRREFSSEEIELRVDANGAFAPSEALEKLKKLSEFELHSIEQPIKQGQIEEMANLCSRTPLPVALDEELIGIFDVTKKEKLLQIIQPQYVIFKPSLIGGYRGTREWMNLAENHGTGWWITSALESNIGLNAISQWTYTKQPHMPQGLGTGSLYTNNFESPLEVKGGKIHYNPAKSWEFNL
ncbi:o-succinylbenzoate synthase [Salegentibacter sp. F188]|uniref:O-succinylbenzoate synthase n=1 Tax=Autumnicola patrickiae TaxID=3075591 RepID=A0ABU3DXR1_9FLAO|nr:o-succinylbenzoate synthase [Salegentibacter sp. F188]MDT0688500.1 o-succinylbenzoate synthase [Salegentibacter sp. F188]